MCPFCLPFYPLSRWTLLLPRLKHRFRDNPRTALPPPGLQCYYWDCPWAILPAAGICCRLSSSPCGHRLLCPKTGASHRRQSIAAIKVQADCPSGSRRKNQAIKKAPAVRRMPCFVSWEFLLTCGFIPGSGGFPECSAQHRTVRRRAAAKSAAEGAAHRRSKRRCPDQAGTPSVRWQWLCGAGH